MMALCLPRMERVASGKAGTSSGRLERSRMEPGRDMACERISCGNRGKGAAMMSHPAAFAWRVSMRIWGIAARIAARKAGCASWGIKMDFTGDEEG